MASVLKILNFLVFTVIQSGCLKNNKNEELNFDLKRFRQEVLECHNNIRRLHRVPDLIYSSKMDRSAREHALYLSTLNDDTLPYSKNLYEENILKSKCITSGCTACSFWYHDEAATYNYTDDNPDTSKFGHFTRMVWKNTRYIGLGVAKSHGNVYVVCQYDPPGNRDYTYRNNVLSPTTRPSLELSTQCYNPGAELETDDLEGYSSVIHQMIQENLECHNNIRLKHGFQPLKSSKELNERAQMRAEWDALHDDCYYIKNECSGFFLLSTTSRRVSGYTACNERYESLLKSCGSDHIDNDQCTQKYHSILLKYTKFIGYGVALSRNGKTLVAINYEPRSDDRNQLFEDEDEAKWLPTKTKSNEELTTKSAFTPDQDSSPEYLDPATTTEISEQNLQCYNDVRLQHGLKPLISSSQLTENAQRHAESLADQDSFTFNIIRNNGSFGEVIYRTNVKEPGYSVCKAVISGSDMIWRTAHYFGIGVAKSKSGWFYIVTQYYLPSSVTDDPDTNILHDRRHPSHSSTAKTTNTPPLIDPDVSVIFRGNPHDDNPQISTSTSKTTNTPPSSDPGFSVFNRENDLFHVITKSPEILSKIMVQNLECHNNFRNKHGAKSLKYNIQLVKFAQNFAENLAKEDRGLIHFKSSYGENLYTSVGFTVSGYSACKSWYSEFTMYDYDFDNPGDLSSVGHFTQMLWKNSHYIGYGIATSHTGKTYVVCVYDPPGNVEYEFKQNVLRPGRLFRFFTGEATSITSIKCKLLILIISLLLSINF